MAVLIAAVMIPPGVLLSVTVVGGMVVPLAVPLALIAWLWWGHFRTWWHWGAALAATGLAFTLLFLISRWDVVGLPVRYLLPAAFLIAALSFVRQRGRRLREHVPTGRWVAAAGLPVLVLLAGLGWTCWGMRAPAETVDLTVPLRGEDYYVLHGGRTPVLNYHGAFNPAQRYALDIVRVGAGGRRAGGIHPSDPAAYVIYADTVYAPMDGRILAVEASRPDQQPPARDRRRPAGNYVLLERDGLVVALLHLKQGSTLVQAGDSVTVGTPLAQVGNSGSTSEPHLHVHALRFEADVPTTLDALHRRGTPVPVTFEGRFLVRNDRFP